MFQSIYTAIISDIEKSLGKGLGWIIDLGINHTISDCNGTRTQNHLVRKGTLNHLAKLSSGAVT